MQAKDQYQQVIEEYAPLLNMAHATQEVQKIQQSLGRECAEAKRCQELYAFLDITSLSPTDSDRSVMEFVDKINRADDLYPQLPSPAAVCLHPRFMEVAKETLRLPEVKIASVAGGFPEGQTNIEVKTVEISLAIADGAEEIDVVMPIGAFLDADYHTVCDEIDQMKDACGDKTLKVIIESGLLPDLDAVCRATLLSLYAGADFVKTSTGKTSVGATPEAVYAMCTTLKAYTRKTGRKAGIKVAGGVKTAAQAMEYHAIATKVLETELTPRNFRIGTSRLANSLISVISGEEVTLF